MPATYPSVVDVKISTSSGEVNLIVVTGDLSFKKKDELYVSGWVIQVGQEATGMALARVDSRFVWGAGNGEKAVRGGHQFPATGTVYSGTFNGTDPIVAEITIGYTWPTRLDVAVDSAPGPVSGAPTAEASSSSPDILHFTA